MRIDAFGGQLGGIQLQAGELSLKIKDHPILTIVMAMATAAAQPLYSLTPRFPKRPSLVGLSSSSMGIVVPSRIRMRLVRFRG
jgi:hypothetical protein